MQGHNVLLHKIFVWLLIHIKIVFSSKVIPSPTGQPVAPQAPRNKATWDERWCAQGLWERRDVSFWLTTAYKYAYVPLSYPHTEAVIFLDMCQRCWCAAGSCSNKPRLFSTRKMISRISHGGHYGLKGWLSAQRQKKTRGPLGTRRPSIAHPLRTCPSMLLTSCDRSAGLSQGPILGQDWGRTGVGG